MVVLKAYLAFFIISQDVVLLIDWRIDLFCFRHEFKCFEFRFLVYYACVYRGGSLFAL